MNMLVQPTAGDQVIMPMVSRGEVEIGITNILELAGYYEGGKNPDLRVIGSVHALRTAFWVRKDAPMQTIADLKGKRVAVRLFGDAHHRSSCRARSLRPAG